jgi:hypothetical protein
MSKINWTTTKEDGDLIQKIVNRFIELYPEDVDDRVSLMMDITACHLNGTKLDLEKLLKADDANFAHDVFGIMGHISREDGQIKREFLPRFSCR